MDYQAPYEACSMPPLFAGINRLDAVQAEGPHLPERSAVAKRILQLRASLRTLDDQLRDADAWEVTPQVEAIFAALDQATWTWFAHFQNDGFCVTADNELQDVWLLAMDTYDSTERH